VTLAATDTQREEIGNYNNTKRGSRCSLLWGIAIAKLYYYISSN
jgi:hypothetical protein